MIHSNQSPSKTQSIFNALESETHYRQMQSDIRDISDKNPILHNMIMRICIDIIIISGDVSSSLQVSTAHDDSLTFMKVNDSVKQSINVKH